LSERRLHHTISFLSDYGTEDEFVGVVKSVIRTIAPHATVVDLTHGIPPHDLRAGALALARAIQYVAGRDVFAPAAAHLAAGVPIEALGPEVDTASLLPGILPLTTREGDTLTCEVLWVDRYGNAQLNVDADELAELGDRVVVRAGEVVRTAVKAGTYADIPAGQLGLVVDSYGLVSLCFDRRSAAAELGLAPVTEVVLEATGDERGTVTEVRLGRRP